MGTHLTAGQRAILGGELISRQKALQRQLSGHLEGRSRTEHAQELLAQDGDDAPQRASDREVDMALSDQEVSELAAIGHALARIQEDNFGQCIDCQAPIPFDRLKAEPQALRCVACESVHERRA